MISDEEIEKALDYLRDTANDAAKCKAERIYLEEYRKSLKALIMSEYKQLPVSAQEREAYCDNRYLKHLEALKIAVRKDEKIKFMRVAAEAKIEAWRSYSANHRAMKIG
tara:strand:- start:430 stop:756 length:327 start_codon:yes stop_codon:yes gene_type:complete